MQISEKVALVGSGMSGIAISHPLDCNIYLLDGGAGYALIDAGTGIESERLLQRLEGLQIDLTKITHLLLTHVHGDHAGGAAFFRDALGLKVVCPRESAPWLENGDLERTSVRAAVASGLYPDDYRFSACIVDQAVSGNDRIRIGELEVRVLETPGHSRGHVCYKGEWAGQKYLFGGDAVFAGGKISLQNLWDSSIQDYAASIRLLHQERPDQLYPGHGPFLLSEGWTPIAQAYDYFSKLSLPPNL
ncbi:MBL fold metallo-hydrolase [Paenibacillus sp. GCM10027626]|uniref:MBL fold metallo-hydrolase n=1 Tax=Paenibacillus sp. GCM10027626 TaxID=3273411 RepID=UPI003637C5DF